MVITDECLSMLIVGILMLFLALTIIGVVIKELFKYGFNDNEIKLVDSFVEDLLSKDNVSNVYVKEIKTISHTTFYRK